MANSKISALTSATTALAGTETLPIVQSSATKQVSVANLTAGRAVSVASLTATGSVTIGTGGPYAVGSVYSDNNWGMLFTTAKSAPGVAEYAWLNYAGTILARITTTNDLAVNLGNVVIETSGKGIDFSATPGTGTSELLADYEEGTWTPNQGGGLTVVGAFSSSGTYTKVGRQVTVTGNVAGATSIAGASGGIICTNLPFTTSGAFAGSVGIGNVNQGSTLIAFSTTIYLSTALTANAGITFTVTYFV